MAKNQDDGLQVVEQILPYFQPEYTVTISPVEGFAYKQDVPIILTGVNISDDYEYTGNTTYAENLKFRAQNYDENGDLTVDTVAVMMLNLTSSDNAVMHYKVKSKS
jgi:hypothetical protein